MDKRDYLKKYFPKTEDFYEIQETAIDAVCNGEKVLCLMPTGGGKSLIYQISGLCLGKSTIVISPLVALMDQQCRDLNRTGLVSVSFTGMDYRKQFKVMTDMVTGILPKFIFVSPERISNDGYLEFILNLRKEDIGLVVIDEVHCVSQWGDGFRPAYRNIPSFLGRIFGNHVPGILCLTATLNEKQQQQVIESFGITRLIKGENLWRENLKLNIINLGNGQEETKDDELEKILESHTGEKILVFVHRKFGKKGTTKTLCEKYKDSYEGVAYFDSDMSDAEKTSVLEGFSNGSIKIVFATSAFGMGVDIKDIRVVINYLISETVEQYYQEVGRAGRDGKTAYGFLLYTNQSKRGRTMLLNSSLCTQASLTREWEERRLKEGQLFKHVSYESMNEEQRIAFSLLSDYGMIRIVAKGVQSINCFEGITPKGKKFLNDMMQFSRSGLVAVIARKMEINISTLTMDIWKNCAEGNIRAKLAPSKAIFFTTSEDMPKEMVDRILLDQQIKKDARLKDFQKFVDGIEAGKTAEELIKNALDI